MINAAVFVILQFQAIFRTSPPWSHLGRSRHYPTSENTLSHCVC